jgi:hypothetical protein
VPLEVVVDLEVLVCPFEGAQRAQEGEVLSRVLMRISD